MRSPFTTAPPLALPLLLLPLLLAAPVLGQEAAAAAPDAPNAAVDRQLREGMLRYRLDVAGEEAEPLRLLLERMLADETRSHAERARDALEALRERMGLSSGMPDIPVAEPAAKLAPAEALRLDAIDRTYRALRSGHGPGGACCACGTPFQVTDLRLGRDVAPGSAELSWNPSPGAAVYNVYGGSLTNLSDLTCRLAGLTSTSVVDSSLPAPLLLYLVSAESCAESGVGDATAGPRMVPQACP